MPVRAGVTRSPDPGIAQVVLPPEAGRGGRWAEELPFRDLGSSVEIDASALTFAEPLFAARLAACIDFHSERGATIEVIPPGRREVANYLSRLGLHRHLSSNCVFPLREVAARDRRDVLIPLTRLRSRHDIEPLAEELLALLQAQLGKGSEAIDPLVSGLGELASNAAEHGSSPFGVYLSPGFRSCWASGGGFLGLGPVFVGFLVVAASFGVGTRLVLLWG